MATSGSFNARLGRTLRALRTQAAVTMERLSEEAGIDISFLSRLERGRVGLGLENAGKIADALHVSVADLMGESDGPKNNLRASRLAARAARLGPEAMKAAEVMLQAMEAQAAYGERRRTPRS